MADSRVGALREIAVLFVRLGLSAFGGPAAHVALMESEFVQRRQWISRQRFLDLFGVASLIPGPSSTELAIFLGYERAGVAGLIVAGLSFILPAALLVGFIASLYVRYSAMPQVGGVLYGIGPVVIAIVAQAVWGLGKTAIKTPRLAVLALAAGVAAAFGVSAVLVLVVTGMASAALRAERSAPAFFIAPLAAGATKLTMSGLFLFFLKVGATVFGSGYVLLAYLHDDLVTRSHWLTETQLLDAVAVGQVTPGPVFTTATFIGYLLGGKLGAALATIGIFLPGFLLVAACRPLLSRIRASPSAGAFLDGVNAASLALMTVVGIQLGHAAFVDVWTVAIGALALAGLLALRMNSTWIVLFGAVSGGVIHALR